MLILIGLLILLTYSKKDKKIQKIFNKNHDFKSKIKQVQQSKLSYHPVTFENFISDEDINPETRSFHAGLPVKSGEKWIANCWIRENKFT